MAMAADRLHQRFDRMRERPVADIMQEGGCPEKERIILIKREMVTEACRQMHRPECMLEPGMVCTRIDEE
jgi:hypothetical protein